jgi:hypothetical protein
MYGRVWSVLVKRWRDLDLGGAIHDLAWNWFAARHIAGIVEVKPDEAVNDSFGSVHPADTMDTDPDKDPEAGGKGIGEKAAE